MPISLDTPKIFTLDKIKIDKFEVVPESGFVIIHFSKGYENELGNFISVEQSRADFYSVEFEPNLYQSVKDKLYNMLVTHINSPAPIKE